MTATRVRVSVGATVPGAEQFSSLRVEFGCEMDVAKGEEAATRKILLEQQSRELTDWKGAVHAGHGVKERFEAAAPAPVAEPKPLNAEDPYKDLGFKQSAKKSNLGTLAVTDELLKNPVALELYQRLKEFKTLKVGKNQYRFSEFQGREYLQKWSQIPIG